MSYAMLVAASGWCVCVCLPFFALISCSAWTNTRYLIPLYPNFLFLPVLFVALDVFFTSPKL